MSGRANVAWWTCKWLLQIPAYLVTSYVIRSLIGGLYKSLIRAGANLPPNLLLWHMLWVSIVDGFLAGLIGLFVVRAMLLLPNPTALPTGPAWRRPQAWTWILPTCWFALGVFAWLTDHVHPSVLASSSGLEASDFVTAFFGAGCNLTGGNFSSWTLRGCMTQMSYTHPWLGTIGYSAAAFVLPEHRRGLRGSLTPTEQASEHNQSDSIAQ